MLAAGTQADGAATLLIEAGAKLDVKNKDGDTPLHWAVAHGHSDIVKVLLGAGADKDVKENQEAENEGMKKK